MFIRDLNIAVIDRNFYFIFFLVYWILTCRHIGVSTTPGAMQFTFIPCRISSRPVDWVMLITAAFVAQYTYILYFL